MFTVIDFIGGFRLVGPTIYKLGALLTFENRLRFSVVNARSACVQRPCMCIDLVAFSYRVSRVCVHPNNCTVMFIYFNFYVIKIIKLFMPSFLF